MISRIVRADPTDGDDEHNREPSRPDSVSNGATRAVTPPLPRAPLSGWISRFEFIQTYGLRLLQWYKGQSALVQATTLSIVGWVSALALCMLASFR